MRLKDRGGYTLMETVISVAIGLMIIVSVGTAMELGIFAATDNRGRLSATNALREELETLRRINFDTMVAYGANSNFTTPQIAQLPGSVGTRAIVASFGADIKKVTLTGSWQSRRGVTLTQSLTTYLSRRGLNGA